MPRRLSIPSPEKLCLELYLIYSYEGEWEPEWAEFQGALDLPTVSKDVMDQALAGWTKPLVQQLGPPPEGRLRKLPSRLCGYRDTCPFHIEKDCNVLSKKMPWCFEPEGFKSVERGAPGLAARVIGMWREGVYVVVVEESSDE